MAKLPFVDALVIDERKLSDYLLNDRHPQGAAKARFLRRFGFSFRLLNDLRTALLRHAHNHEVFASHQTSFGTIFEIDGALRSPDGRDPLVRTVWMLEIDAAGPRLITLVPRASLE